MGDTITIKALTKTGYLKSVNVKVYGFIEFKGLEKSGLAGVMSLMDLMTLRDLYGYLTNEKAKEIAELKAAAGLGEWTARTPRPSCSARRAQGRWSRQQSRLDEEALVGRRDQRAAQRDLDGRVYTQEEIDDGRGAQRGDPAGGPDQAGRHPEGHRGRRCKGAKLPLKVVTWQKASGMVGQFVTLARIVLYVAVLIIFVVALVIINNAMVMATLQRVKEIGTMRAIGAQRRFVWVMLLVETVAIGLFFGALGSALGVGLLQLIRSRGGIPATNDAALLLLLRARPSSRWSAAAACWWPWSSSSW